MNILAICGSLRAHSFNRAALRAAVALAPDGMTITIAEIGDLPLYNDDVRLAGYPPPVERLRAQIRDADALLFVTPEYNYSLPGVLKNAIDWASRPPDQPFAGKPAAVFGASTSLMGTVRAQNHLRQIAVFIDLKMVNKPEVMITLAAQRFDPEGRLIDDKARELIQKLLAALGDWTRQLRP